MSQSTAFDLLAVHPFTASLPTSWLRRLAAAGSPAFRSAGTRLFRQGAAADRFWLPAPSV